MANIILSSNLLKYSFRIGLDFTIQICENFLASAQCSAMMVTLICYCVVYWDGISCVLRSGVCSNHQPYIKSTNNITPIKCII